MCSQKCQLPDMHSQQNSNKATLSCFSPHTVNKYPYVAYLVPLFPIFLYLLFMILLYKMAPKHTAEVLACVLEPKKATMCLTEEMYVRLASFRHKVALSSVLIDEKYILNKVCLNRNTYKTRLCVNW